MQIIQNEHEYTVLRILHTLYNVASIEYFIVDYHYAIHKQNIYTYTYMLSVCAYLYLNATNAAKYTAHTTKHEKSTVCV